MTFGLARGRTLCLWVLFVGILLAAPVSGRAGDTVAASADEAIVTGRDFERQRLWREAIDHYELAIKSWPENSDLVYGLRRSKFQFSIDRRYSDDSFNKGLLTQPRADSLDLLDSVVNNIKSRFVEAIDTKSIIAHGTESLWLALANPKFLEQNLIATDYAKVQELRTLLRQEYWNRPLESHGDLRRVVGEVCDSAQRIAGVPPGAVIMEYVFGACNCLDDYSSVLTPARYSDMYSNIDGQFVGIGIVMEGTLGKGMELVDVLPDSPAMESGLLAGEWIISIDGVDCRFLSTEEAAGLLVGSSGSQVRLELDGESTEPHVANCYRREVKVKSIPVAKMVNQECGVAYIRMTTFQKRTADELEHALQDLQKQGMRALIWDLRGNPGGLLDEGVAVADVFINDGVIATTRGRLPEDSEVFDAFGPGTWQLPLVVLIDGYSASASELVAGCIKDHHRGTLVGRNSYGKWSVQTIASLNSGLGMRLTTARFYSPDGHSYSKIGIEPDVRVEAPENQSERRSSSASVDPATDPDLKAALEILCRQSYTRR